MCNSANLRSSLHVASRFVPRARWIQTLSLLFASQVFGSVLISVINFDADELTLTISGGSGSAVEGTAPGSSPEILDFAPGPGYFWITTNTFTASPADLGTLPATNLGNTVASIDIYDNAAGDTVYITMTDPLVEGDYFLSDLTISWTATGLFDPVGVGSDPLVAYWGTNASYDAASGTVQSTASLNVPEPTALGALFGIFVLGAVVFRRRR